MLKTEYEKILGIDFGTKKIGIAVSGGNGKFGLPKCVLKNNKDLMRNLTKIIQEENILEIGELGIAFRINEKVSRLKNLITSNKKPVNENIEDSWYDIAVYAIIAMLYKKGYFQKLDLSPKNKK